MSIQDVQDIQEYEKKTMRYILKRILDGDFPNSPDVSYVELSEWEWDELAEKFRGRWRDRDTQGEL